MNLIVQKYQIKTAEGQRQTKRGEFFFKKKKQVRLILIWAKTKKKIEIIYLSTWRLQCKSSFSDLPDYDGVGVAKMRLLFFLKVISCFFFCFFLVLVRRSLLVHASKTSRRRGHLSRLLLLSYISTNYERPMSLDILRMKKVCVSWHPNHHHNTIFLTSGLVE